MLQRLNSKPPAPLKQMPNDHAVFTKDGKMREQYYKLCQEININPEELYPRPLESFKDSKAIRNVQILRYNNYENKRRGKSFTFLH